MSDQSSQEQGSVAEEEPLFKCEMCNKEYTTKASYMEHVTTAHSLTEEVVGNWACVLCCETFNSDSDLEKHVNGIHEAREVTPEITQHTLVDEQSSRYRCTVCKSPFPTKTTLRKHLLCVHKAKTKHKRVFTKVCPLCLFSSHSSSKTVMYQHFEEQHKISLKWEKHLFNSFNEFDLWKTEVETNTVSSYIKHSTIKNNTITYHCHRSGSYKRRSKELKRSKALVSCKINAFCPSEMKVYVKSGGVEVHYLPTHIGHSNELNHLQLSVKDKCAVKAKLEGSQTCQEDILSSFNKSVTVDGELRRINLLRKHDIHNITNRCGLKKEANKKYPEPISVQSFVKAVAQSDDVMLMICKALGVYSNIYPDLKENDFLLIYMSKNQHKILMKHGKGTVCVDYTTGKNFYLFTLSVMNDNGEGIPVAFMFTNKVEESTLSTFFEEIKRVCGTILCQVFMSDMEEMIYSAWTSIMGRPKERIFSTWHVLESWRKNLDSKVEDKEIREKTFNWLQNLICEMNEDVFLQMLNTILTEDEELRLFVEFFRREFVTSRPYKLWAHSYGSNADLNTNMSLENLNRAVRFSYMKGGKRQLSVEEAVITALKLIKDKEFLMIFDMKLETLKLKRNSVRCKHKKSLGMDIERVKPMDNNMWKVLLSKKEEFCVVMRKGTCEDCQLKCFHCKTCHHEYMCSCVAYSIERDMCEHIHLVVQSLSVTSVENTMEVTEAIPGLVIGTDRNEHYLTDQNDINFYFQEGVQSITGVEITLESDTYVKCEAEALDQNSIGSYNMVENEEVVNVYSLDGEQEVVYLDERDIIVNADVESVYNLQEEKSKLVLEFEQFLDTKITEMKQLDTVKRGLTRIMARKWAVARKKSLKVPRNPRRRKAPNVPQASRKPSKVLEDQL